MTSAKQKAEDNKLRMLEHFMKQELQRTLVELLKREKLYEESLKAFGTVTVSLKACRPVGYKPKFPNIRKLGELLSEKRIKELGYSHDIWKRMYHALLNDGFEDDSPVEIILQHYADGSFRLAPNVGEKTLTALNQVLKDCGYSPLP